MPLSHLTYGYQADLLILHTYKVLHSTPFKMPKKINGMLNNLLLLLLVRRLSAESG